MINHLRVFKIYNNKMRFYIMGQTNGIESINKIKFNQMI